MREALRAGCLPVGSRRPSTRQSITHSEFATATLLLFCLKEPGRNQNQSSALRGAVMAGEKLPSSQACSLQRSFFCHSTSSDSTAS